MKRDILALISILSVAASHADAQAIPNAPATATAPATVAARPADVASVDAIIAALYDANTIMVDQKRDADRFRSLFVPGARLIGNIVQVFSTYETHRASADSNPVHGINSIQLFNDGTRWWVVGVLWDNERPGKTIPPEFLKRRP